MRARCDSEHCQDRGLCSKRIVEDLGDHQPNGKVNPHVPSEEACRRNGKQNIGSNNVDYRKSKKPGLVESCSWFTGYAFFTDNSLYLRKPKTCKVDRDAVGDDAQHKHPPPHGEHGGLLVLRPERTDPPFTPKGDGRFDVQEGRHKKQVDGHHPDAVVFPGQRLHYLRERRVLRPWRRRRVLRRRPSPWVGPYFASTSLT